MKRNTMPLKESKCSLLRPRKSMTDLSERKRRTIKKSNKQRKRRSRLIDKVKRISICRTNVS